MIKNRALPFVAALALGGSFSAVAQTVAADGSLGVSYAFSLPAARGRYQPWLALTYDSNAGTTNYGVGWTLTSNYVEAVTRATHNTDSTQRARYFLSSAGGKRLLVAAGDNSYRADVSSSYFSVTPSVTPSASATPTTWTAVDGVGNKYTYGCVPSTAATCSRWYLKFVQDVDNNTTSFDYGSTASDAPETSTCSGNATAPTALLLRISYNFAIDATTPVSTVELAYEVSPEPSVQAISGCMVTHDHRLSSVTVNRSVSAGSPPPVVSLGSWTLGYVHNGSTDTHRDLLDHIQRNDRAGAPLGLATSFVYETDFDPVKVPPLAAAADFTFAGGDAFGHLPSTQCWSWGLGDGTTCDVSQAAVFMDMDGDGLPDIVYGGSDSMAGVTALYWARNLGSASGHPTFAAMTQIPGADGKSRTSVPDPRAAPWPGFISTLNSDGTTPTGEEAHGYYSGHTLKGNNGGPWVAMGPNNFTGTCPANGKFANGTPCPPPPIGNGALGMVADFNGDGAPDLISSGCGGSARALSVWFAQIDPTTGALSYADAPSCVDATAAFNQMQTMYQVQQLPVSYTMPGPRLFTGSGTTTNTWIQLADFDGDGVLDFIIADSNSATWFVYPGYSPGKDTSGHTLWAFAATPLPNVAAGYAWPQNAAMSPNIYPIRSVMGPMAAAVYDDPSHPPYDPSQLLGGKTIIDFVDVNGDGLPDRVVAFQWSDGSALHNSWFVDYNTGTGFVETQGPSNVRGLFQKDLPYQDAWVTTHDSALFDLNRDGRPDLIIRSGPNSVTSAGNTACTGPGDSMKVWYGSPTGLNGNSGFVEGPCLDNPTGVPSWRPFDNYTDLDDLSTSKMYNEGFADLDGDGVLDFYRAPGPSEGMPINHWYFYRGTHQKRRSDLLVSMTSSSGSTQTYHWAPSTAYSAGISGSPMVGDVVAAIDSSGPAMSPLTVTYSYAGLKAVKVWDDPTQSQNESLGFTVGYATPSVGGLVSQTTYGSTHDTQGLVVSAAKGTATPPWTNGAGVIESSAATWSSSSIGSNVIAGTTYLYPTYVYPSAQTRSRTEMGAAPVSVQTAQPPDAYGNILTMTTTPDALPSASTAPSLTIKRAFATGPKSACPSCVIDEAITASNGTELGHSYYHYDLAVGVNVSPSSATADSVSTVVAKGHLSYVQTACQSCANPYEVASATYYSTSGNVLRSVRSYSGQAIASVTEEITYDPFDDLSIISRVAKDAPPPPTGTAPPQPPYTSLTTTFTYTSYGDVASVVGPVLGGTAPTSTPLHAMALHRSYDPAGRVVAESDQPLGTTITHALRAFEYVLPTVTTPGAVKSYVFASDPPSFTAGGPVSPSNDSTQVITYFDALGRAVQERVRLGSGAAPKSTGGNVITSRSPPNIPSAATCSLTG
ncbi:MAG TPA: SpvB/TcaC N-terminal domain-containing protein [Myxococcales bacterium]